MNEHVNPDSGARQISASAASLDTSVTVVPVRRPAGLNEAARNAAANLKRAAISPVLVTGLARLLEFGLLVVSGIAVFALYLSSSVAVDGWYRLSLFGGPLLAVFLIQTSGAYTLPALRRPLMTLGRVYVAWAGVFAAFALTVFLAKAGDNYSRVWAGGWFVAGLAVLTVFRVSLAQLIRHWTAIGALERRAVIVGGGERAEELIRALEKETDSDIRICGIFDDRKDQRSPRSVAGYPKLGTIAELVDFGRIARIDLLIVSLPLTAENRLLQFFKQLWVLPVDIRLSAHMSRLHFRPRTYSFVGNVPFLAVADKPIADWDYVAKWIFDHVIGGLILALAAPVMALTALAIKLDSPGPIFFRQKRYGFNNELIEVYKFRSMHANVADINASTLVTRGDPRVTRVGRFIRKTSLDELPQLVNVVFKGNLSLVGPRPHAVQAKASNRLYGEVVDGYFARHRVKPGITGWAQVNGWRGETDTEEKIQQRVQHDLTYIENWSVLFDLKILAMTPFALMSTESAY